jgi:hypothetical protein
MTANEALYYPYIHVRDENWLKGTLLLFERVQRMIPLHLNNVYDDDIWVHAYSSYPNPLLSPANLYSERVFRAQQHLAQRIGNDAQDPQFRYRYGEDETRQRMALDDPGFQIHAMKMEPNLTEALKKGGFAWLPRHPDGGDYLEMHSDIGNVVMGTLAVACAQSEDLDVVADPSSGRLHQCLAERNSEDLYDAWLHPNLAMRGPLAATGQELFNFMVRFPCNLEDVTPKDLQSLGADREPIRDLIAKLDEAARKIKMDPGPKRDEAFRDATAAALEGWRQDRKNLHGFWRRFWGDGLLDAGAKFIDTAAEKAIPAGLSGSAFATAAGATALASGLIGAGVGLGISVVVIAYKSYAATVQQEAKSPYRFLTALEEKGVLISRNLRM